jgi:chromosome partitioning protein
MRAVISVVNVARGVGKSTTAVSLAAELALRDFETLLIDADPQAEATAHLVDPESVRLSVADLLFAPDTRLQETAEGPRFGLEDVLVPTAIPRLRLAPSSIRLASGEGDTPLSLKGLNSQLRSFDRPCDFAVIDTPSSLGPIAAACRFASTHLLVPVAPRTQGVQGLRYLVENLGNMPCDRGQVELLGVVCNLFDCRSHASGEFYEGLKREWGDKVLRTIIHRDDKIETCAGLRQPVQAYAPTSVAATLYAELADEIMLLLGVGASLGIPVQ